jgi:anthranilate synthase/aminodeoxychorismate synthase-like glutamine amidotransferase
LIGDSSVNVLIVDNYDSFTHNLAQALRGLGAHVDVVLNDRVTLEEIERARYGGVLLSPGPCTPDDAGVTLAIAEKLAGKTPLLGICLGHQALAQAFGGRVVRYDAPMHGRASAIRHTGAGSLRGVPSPFSAGRYHSLAVERSSLPASLAVTAVSEDDGAVMAICDETRRLEGLQFHPESILTPLGERILATWLERLAAWSGEGRRAWT